MKADELVEYEDGEPEKYTNFEELAKRVEILQDVVNELTEILRANHLVRHEKIEAPYFDNDKLFTELEEEYNITNGIVEDDE